VVRVIGRARRESPFGGDGFDLAGGNELLYGIAPRDTLDRDNRLQ